MNEQLQGGIDMEKTSEKMAVVLGRFGDLGLGNPDGIPTEFADYDTASLQLCAEQNAESLIDPTDLTCAACVDGRHRICNADGSKCEIHLRRVGGSASNLGVAYNADAAILRSFDTSTSLGKQIQAVDDYMGERSAHEGGCGGANGEVADHELIAHDPAIMNATKALMSIPEVDAYLGASYDEMLGERVRQNAARTAEFLRDNNWNGQKYVDGVVTQHPSGVETLEVDENDSEFHGHKESSLTIVIGDKTMPLDHEGFVWNLKATMQAAHRLAGDRGREGYTQAIIADIAKHMAVCKRLPSEKTPIFLVVA